MEKITTIEADLHPRDARYSIVAARFNDFVVNALIKGALSCLDRHGVDRNAIELIRVPGAFELPLATQFMAEKEGISSVISLGAIIRGDTPHFDFISSSCLEGLQEVALKTRIPVICGVLTTNTIEQAEERSDPNKMNKGKEFALTALNMVDSLS